MILEICVKDIGSESDKISGLEKIIYYYKASTATSYSSKTTTFTGEPTTLQHTSITISGLSAGTKYSMYAVIYDVAGNTTTSNTITVETYIELKDANSTIQSKYNFYGSVTATAPYYGENYLNLNGVENLTTGMILYVSNDITDYHGYTTKSGYYYLTGNLGANYTAWTYYYLGTGYIVNSTTTPTMVELRKASDHVKIANKFGEATVSSSGSNVAIQKVIYNGVEYTTTDFVSFGLSGSKLTSNGMIIYCDYNGITAGYYQFIATGSSSANMYLIQSSSWKYLGTSYSVMEPDA